MQFLPAAALGLGLGAAVFAAAAQENTVDFNIPAQPLASALDAFSKQSGLHLFYADGIVQGKRSAGLQGRYRSGEALAHLAADAGISYTFTAGNTVAVKAQGNEKPETLPAVTVSGDVDGQLDGVSTDESFTTPSIAESRRKLRQVPGGTTLIEGERIKEGAALTVNDALAYVPGVYVGDSAGGVAGGSRISIRGSDINSFISPIYGLKILRNGLPFTNANGASDTESFNLDPIQQIEVYRGANALEYGASNLGGAINFVTPTGYTADLFKVGMVLGTNGYVKPQVSGGGVLGHGWDAYGSFSYQDYNGNREHNQQELFYGYGNIGYRWNDRHETRLHVDIQDHNYQLASPLTQEQLEQNPHQNPSQSVDPNGFPVYRVDLRHSILLDDGDKFDFGTYYFSKDFSFSGSDFGFHRDSWQDFGFNWRHQINGRLFGLQNRIVWGGLTQWMWINDRNFDANGSARGALNFNERDAWNNVEAYLEDQLKLTDAVTLVLGGQVNYRKVEYERKFRDLDPGQSSPANQDFFNFNPKLGFTWQVMPAMQLYGNLSRSAEPPPLGNLNQVFLNPKRTSQTASTIEIGTRDGDERFKWDLAFYHAWINDEILIIRNPFNPLEFTTTNAGNTQHTGIELGLESTLPLSLMAEGDQLRMRGTYTWNNFHFDSDPSLKDNRLPGIPEHNARFEMLYQHPGGFYAGPNLQVAGSNWVDFTNTLAARPYALLGARVGWDDGNHWKVFVDGRNLTNEHYTASVFVTGDAEGKDLAQFNPGTTRMVFGGFEYRY